MSSLFKPNSVKENLIICPKCSSIPSVIIDKVSHDKVTIHCECSYHETLPISNFLNRQVHLSDNSNHSCQFLSSHQTKAAKKFCVHCQQWLCEECLTLHNDIKITKNHLLLDYLLKNETKCSLHNDNDYEFHCNLHNNNLCKICYKEHSTHSNMIVSLKDFYSSKKIEEIKHQLEQTKVFIDKYNRNIYEKLEYIKKTIAQIEKIHEENKKINENLFKMFDNLFDNSKLDINNYNLYNNIISNVIVNIDNKLINDKIEGLNVVINYLQDQRYYRLFSISSFNKGYNNVKDYDNYQNNERNIQNYIYNY